MRVIEWCARQSSHHLHDENGFLHVWGIPLLSQSLHAARSAQVKHNVLRHTEMRLQRTQGLLGEHKWDATSFCCAAESSGTCRLEAEPRQQRHEGCFRNASRRQSRGAPCSQAVGLVKHVCGATFREQPGGNSLPHPVRSPKCATEAERGPYGTLA